MTLEKVKAILDEAAATVNGPRQADYGHPRINFQRIADIWNIHLSARLKAPITARDVAIMQIGLKLAREAQGPKYDSLLDIIGYAALAEEVSSEPATITSTFDPYATFSTEQAGKAAMKLAETLSKA